MYMSALHATTSAVCGHQHCNTTAAVVAPTLCLLHLLDIHSGPSAASKRLDPKLLLQSSDLSRQESWQAVFKEGPSGVARAVQGFSSTQ
jgi:hypothetical protein